MKWETIKENCARDLYTDIQNSINHIDLIGIYSLQKMIKTSKLNKYRQCQQEVADICWEIITNWDIRCIKDLIEVFPNKVPTFIKKGNYCIEYSDNGWELINENNYETR